jgi:hypothetical protein
VTELLFPFSKCNPISGVYLKEGVSAKKGESSFRLKVLLWF